MKKYEVEAELIVTCVKVVEADNMAHALDKAINISSQEWMHFNESIDGLNIVKIKDKS